jgi:segregation and condensation protein B
VSELARRLEALLFLSPEPVAGAELREALDCSGEELDARSPSCARRWRRARGVELKEVAGGLTLASAPEHEDAARRLLARPRTPPLTPAQAETLSIVAYLEPVSRPEITRIRGVSADSASGTLLERGSSRRPAARRSARSCTARRRCSSSSSAWRRSPTCPTSAPGIRRPRSRPSCASGS